MCGFYNWCAETAHHSWFAHGFTTIAIALVFRFCINLFSNQPESPDALVFGAGVGLLFYIGKELGNWWTYARSGRFNEQDKDGVKRYIDGFGDLVGPLFVFLGIFLQWRLM